MAALADPGREDRRGHAVAIRTNRRFQEAGPFSEHIHDPQHDAIGSIAIEAREEGCIEIGAAISLRLEQQLGEVKFGRHSDILHSHKIYYGTF